ncbi:MAG: hypothetical protein RI894_1103, partial [Bacteroidota bacterium]
MLKQFIFREFTSYRLILQGFKASLMFCIMFCIMFCLPFCLTLCALLVCSQAMFAQDAANFPLKSKGELPPEFLTKSSDKYKKAVEQISKKERGSRKRLKKEFYLESTFAIDQLLHNGSVLYDPDFSGYLRSVANKVLKGDNKVLESTRFYVVRSPAVNAFATNGNMVFVCMGLLAQIGSEAQLGFVLSHEIIHSRENHAVNFYIKTDKLRRNMSSSDAIRSGNFDEAMFKRSKFSKELEIEADTKGFEDYYAKSGYKIEEISKAFDVLRYAECPFGNAKFDKSFLESEGLVFPKRYFLDTVAGLKGTNEKESDSLSTHPNISTRRANIDKIIKDKNLSGGSLYLVSEEMFKKWQTVSRKNIPALFLHYNYFQEAFYSAYLLLKDSPNDLYLKKIIAKSLYGYSKFLSEEDATVDAETAGFKEAEGEVQQVFHLFSKLDAEEANVVAINYIWSLYQENKSDKELNWLAHNIARSLAIYSKNELANIATSKTDLPTKPAPKMEELPTKKEEKVKSSKKERNSTTIILTKKAINDEAGKDVAEKKDSTADKKDYLRYALVEWFKDSSFLKDIAKGKLLAKEYENWEGSKAQKAMKAARAKEFKNGARIGADKVVVVSPYYLSVDQHKKQAVEYLRTEKRAATFKKAIIENAKANKIDVEILDPSEFGLDDVEKYNDLTALNDWVSETIDYAPMEFSGYQADKIAEISKKYNTRYFLWTGLITLNKARSPMEIMSGVMLCMTIFGAPIGIYMMVRPEYETLYYAVLYDAQTNRSKLLKYESFGETDHNFIIDSHLYDTFL